MAAPVEGLQDPYMAILDIFTSEHPKLYNKALFGYQKATVNIWTDPSGLTFTKR